MRPPIIYVSSLPTGLPAKLRPYYNPASPVQSAWMDYYDHRAERRARAQTRPPHLGGSLPLAPA